MKKIMFLIAAIAVTMFTGCSNPENNSDDGYHNKDFLVDLPESKGTFPLIDKTLSNKSDKFVFTKDKIFEYEIMDEDEYQESERFYSYESINENEGYLYYKVDKLIFGDYTLYSYEEILKKIEDENNVENLLKYYYNGIKFPTNETERLDYLSYNYDLDLDSPISEKEFFELLYFYNTGCNYIYNPKRSYRQNTSSKLYREEPLPPEPSPEEYLEQLEKDFFKYAISILNENIILKGNESVDELTNIFNSENVNMLLSQYELTTTGNIEKDYSQIVDAIIRDDYSIPSNFSTEEFIKMETDFELDYMNFCYSKINIQKYKVENNTVKLYPICKSAYDILDCYEYYDFDTDELELSYDHLFIFDQSGKQTGDYKIYKFKDGKIYSQNNLINKLTMRYTIDQKNSEGQIQKLTIYIDELGKSGTLTFNAEKFEKTYDLYNLQ